MEKKLTHREEILLIIIYVYLGVSFLWFTESLAVTPDRAEPVTMVVHSVPYINLKVRGTMAVMDKHLEGRNESGRMSITILLYTFLYKKSD